MIEIYSKTLDEEDFNDYLNYAFENNGMNEIELANIEIPGIIGAALPFALAEPTPIGEGLVVIGVIGYTIYTSVFEPDTINFDKGLNNREKSRLKREFDKTTYQPPNNNFNNNQNPLPPIFSEKDQRFFETIDQLPEVPVADIVAFISYCLYYVAKITGKFK